MQVLDSGLVIRDRITLYDMSRVYDLYQQGIQAEKYALSVRRKSRLECLRSLGTAKKYFAQIIRILTTTEKVKRIHYRYLSEILRCTDLLSKGKHEIPNPDNDPKNTLHRVLSWVGARLNKLPYEVAKDCTVEELRGISEQITRRDIEKQINMLLGYHVPKKAMKNIEKALRRLKSDDDEIDMNSRKQWVNPLRLFDKAFMEPH